MSEMLRFVQNESQKVYAYQDGLWSGKANLKKYNHDLINKLSWNIGQPTDVLEFGAGIGTISEQWALRNGIIPDVVEVDPELRKILSCKGFKCFESMSSASKSYDLVFTSNVLEHIEDDTGILKELFCWIKDGGQLFVYVPAFMFLYSDLDKKAGHFRRYEKKDLVDKLSKVGFVITKCHYSDSLGYFAWMSTKLRNPLKTENQKSVRFYDRYIFPVSKVLDALGFKHLFGKNILVCCRKQAN